MLFLVLNDEVIDKRNRSSEFDYKRKADGSMPVGSADERSGTEVKRTGGHSRWDHQLKNKSEV